jgi:CRP/FNR family transcriptional regulator, cyclic AMP receptor protein
MQTLRAPRRPSARPPSGEFIVSQETIPQFDSHAFLAKAGNGHTVSEHCNGDVIFAQGDAADAVFFIQKGKVKITVVSRTGKEAVVGIFSMDQFFGEGVLSGQPIRISTATAIEECEIVRLSKKEMIKVLHAEPVFAQFFIAHLLARNQRVEEDLVDQLFNSSEKRLARILLLLANFGKEGKPETVIPHMTQEVLAEMVGTTRSRVSFFMNKFRKLGFIEYNGKLTVHSSLLNVVLHD